MAGAAGTVAGHPRDSVLQFGAAVGVVRFIVVNISFSIKGGGCSCGTAHNAGKEGMISYHDIFLLLAAAAGAATCVT